MTRHPLDTLSLMFGLLFAAIGTAALFDAIDFGLFTTDWLWPAVLIGSGIAVLLTVASRDSTPEPASDAEQTIEGHDHDGDDDR